jgi:hypothetical protein
VGPEGGHGASLSGVPLKLKTSSITPRSRSVARNANLAPLKTTSARPDSRLSSSTAAAPSPRERRCLAGARTSSAGLVGVEDHDRDLRPGSDVARVPRLRIGHPENSLYSAGAYQAGETQGTPS